MVEMILALRPDQRIRGIRWVDIEEDPTLRTFLVALAKGRYEPMRGFLIRLALLLLVMIVLTIIEAVDALKTAVFVIGLMVILFRRALALPSLLIFYDDKIAILFGVVVDRSTGLGTYSKRSDITPGSVSSYFKLGNFNPFWRLHHLAICLRGKRLVLSRVDGMAVLSWLYTRRILPEKEITFLAAAKRIKRVIRTLQ